MKFRRESRHGNPPTDAKVLTSIASGGKESEGIMEGTRQKDCVNATHAKFVREKSISWNDRPLFKIHLADFKSAPKTRVYDHKKSF